MNPSESTTAEMNFNRRDFLKGGSLATLMTMMGGVRLMAEPEKTEAKTEGAKIKVKVAVIGLGPQGREILDFLHRVPPEQKVQPEVVAICDNYPAFLKRSTSKAPGAKAVEDYKAILADKDVQAVIVATATHQHKDIVIEALKAGKHVYCEAPIANTLEDAKAMATAAKAAIGTVFQPGLQMRSDPQRHFLFPFIRSGALGKSVMARAQWHKKQSWRQTSPNAEREKAINWRLSKETSLGLVGEIGIHAIDQAAWLLNLEPIAVTGFGSTTFWKDDGRTVPDTVQAVIEFPGGVRMSYDATLASSFDSDYELLFGSDATIMMREDNIRRQAAWMFKEVDSPLLGWEVYARKDNFYKETGIALAAGSSKQTSLVEKSDDPASVLTPLYHALNAFLGNCSEVSAAVADFVETYGANADKKALATNLAGIELRKAATWKEGYAATVLAIKANEAIMGGKRIELKKDMFEIA